MGGELPYKQKYNLFSASKEKCEFYSNNYVLFY